MVTYGRQEIKMKRSIEPFISWKIKGGGVMVLVYELWWFCIGGGKVVVLYWW